MPESLNCPSCGAPCSPDTTRCVYCGSRLATVACTACLGSMFAGAQFCPHCGAKAGAVTVESGAALRCPGCGGDMPSVRVGQTSLHSCTQCGSAWVAPDAFAQLCADREATGALTSIVGASGGAPAPSSPAPRVRYVRCCVCNKTMNRVNFGRTSGIVVDVCKGHGVWFEGDQLRETLAFVARGGLQQPHAAAGHGPTDFVGDPALDPRAATNIVVRLDAGNDSLSGALSPLKFFLNALLS